MQKKSFIFYSLFLLVSAVLISGNGCLNTSPNKSDKDSNSNISTSNTLYKNINLGFSIQYPKEYRVEEINMTGTTTAREVLFFYPGTGGEPALRIGKYQDTTQKLMELRIKESSAYQRMPDEIIAGKTAKVICASATEGSFCVYYIEHNQTTFVIEDYSNQMLYKNFMILS